MPKVIKFEQKAPSDIAFEIVDGYRMVLMTIISAYYEHARGVGADAFIVKHYRNCQSAKKIGEGVIPPSSPMDTELLEELESFLDRKKGWAEINISAIPTCIVKAQEKELGLNATYVRCQDGIIACGWYDSGHTAKRGLKMAAFVLYALGILNVKYDEDLWLITYKYLPYDSELGRPYVADRFIADGIAAEKFNT